MRLLKIFIPVMLVLFLSQCGMKKDIKPWDHGKLEVSTNGRFLQHEDGTPFFWLGDTGWLLFHKLTREEAEVYLQDRIDKGFNVVQAMLIHRMPGVNVYGDTAMVNKRPNFTEGNDFTDSLQYDWWDHVDYVIDLAAQKGIYMGLVPMWGSVIKSESLLLEDVNVYGKFLAERYRDKPNVIWLNGGDVSGDRYPECWQAMGNILNENDPDHLITFHPRGRSQSAWWFHHEDWLDFNMFQSGHRAYDTRRPTDDSLTWKGEDNWLYVLEDYQKEPPKPTIDGEPSYEDIPIGLHDSKNGYWQARDARRYAWWSVMAGAFGHTYGHSAVMQMHRPQDGKGAYDVRKTWQEGVSDSGAFQMQYVKDLFLSRPYFERMHDPALIYGNPGYRYDRVIGCRGNSFAFLYTYTGRPFKVQLGIISGDSLKGWWYNPRNGKSQLIGKIANEGVQMFEPPGEIAEGNDRVLVLDDSNKDYIIPGQVVK